MSVRDTIRKARPTVAEYTLTDGSKVWVRAMSGAGRAKYMAYVEKAKANGGIRSEVIAAMGLSEQDGTLVFDIEVEADLAEVRNLDGQDLDGIGLKLFEISGLAKGAVEDAAKNSEASPSCSSGTSSQPTSSTAP